MRLFILAAVGISLAGAAFALPFDKTKVAPLSPTEAKTQKCELHGTRLQNGTAPILYGRRGSVVPFNTAKSAFPRARSHVFGGCIVSENSPGSQRVRFCPKCRTAEKRWLAARKLSLPTR